MENTTEVVLSLKGHDKGAYFAVVGSAGGEHVLIADGRHRKIEKPKKKKRKHLLPVGRITLPDPETCTNRVLWRALREYH